MKEFIYFLAFDFCRFCMDICFFHPHHNDQWPSTKLSRRRLWKNDKPRKNVKSWENN